MALTNSICVMLRTSPFHRESYARLILGVILQFYQRCFDRFQLLVARDGALDEDRTGGAILGAQWAQSSQFAPCLAELLGCAQDDSTRRQQLCRQETQLELGALGKDTFARDHLIPSSRAIGELCSLHWSVVSNSYTYNTSEPA
jgi:exocyst complex component 4